jgi:hypothetical protein
MNLLAVANKLTVSPGPPQSLMSAAFSAALLISAPSVAQAQERTTNLGKVGQWNILAIYQQGNLHRCTAELINGSGSLRIALEHSGNWALSAPGLGLRENPVVVGASFNRMNEPQIDFKNYGGQRISAPLSRPWVDEFRKNGTLKLTYAGRAYTWTFVDSGAAMREVGNCVSKYK